MHTDLNPWIPEHGRISREYLPPSPGCGGVGFASFPLEKDVFIGGKEQGKVKFYALGGVFIFIYKAEQVNLGPHGNSQEQTARNRFDQ